jgi:hypothetical protein
MLGSRKPVQGNSGYGWKKTVLSSAIRENPGWVIGPDPFPLVQGKGETQVQVGFRDSPTSTASFPLSSQLLQSPYYPVSSIGTTPVPQPPSYSLHTYRTQSFFVNLFSAGSFGHISFHVYWCFLPVYVCVWVSNPLELELQKVVSCHVGARN